jgi:hypothetical protein
VEAVSILLGPVKSAIKSLEYKTTTLADCFVELIKLSQRIKSLPLVSNYGFKDECIDLFNKRWKQFDIDLYLLAYLMHPKYRGKGLRDIVFRDVCITALKVWTKMGGGETSSATLIGQIRKYYQGQKPFDLPFCSGTDNVFIWWQLCNPVRKEDNHIQKLALNILSITPHNVACERVFSILGWFANKRRTK